MTRDHAHDEHDIEEVIRRAVAGFVTRSDRTYDFSAGLAEVYARAGLPVPVSSLVPQSVEPSTGSAVGAASRACDLIDTILSFLRTVAVPPPDLPVSDLDQALQVLARLRGRLATRGLDVASAGRLLQLVDECIGRADQSLRGFGLSLDDAIHSQIGGFVAGRIDVVRMLHDLRREVEAALREKVGQGPAGLPRRRGATKKSVKESGRWDSEAGLS
jgi:hypothetical protein